MPNCYESYLRNLRVGDSVNLVNPMSLRRRGIVVENADRGLRVRIDVDGMGHRVVRAFGRRTGCTRSGTSFYRIESPPVSY